PGETLVCELVGFCRHAEAVAGLEADIAKLSRKRVPRSTAIRIHVDAGESFAGELIGNHAARRVYRCPCVVNGSRTFWIPARRLLARILYAHRPTSRLRQHCGIHCGIVGVAASIGTRTNDPDRANLLDGNTQCQRDSVLDEMRLLRAGPARHVAVCDLDESAGRPHAGVRLDWPLVYRRNHLRSRLEDLIDIPGFLAPNLALAHRRVADVRVERGLIRERRLCL